MPKAGKRLRDTRMRLEQSAKMQKTINAPMQNCFTLCSSNHGVVERRSLTNTSAKINTQHDKDKYKDEHRESHESTESHREPPRAIRSAFCAGPSSLLAPRPPPDCSPPRANVTCHSSPTCPTMPAAAASSSASSPKSHDEKPSWNSGAWSLI